MSKPPHSVPEGAPTLHGMERTEELRRSLQIEASRERRPGSKDSDRVLRQDIGAAPFFQISDVEAVRMFGKAFGPELERLKNTQPTVEASPIKTRGGFGEFFLTPSQLLFNADFPEINRSVVGVLALKWLVSDNYEAFTSSQSSEVRLSRKSFAALREMFLEGLKSSGDVYALIVATIVNDLGKDPSLMEEIRPDLPPDQKHPNHDQVVYLAAKVGRVPLISEFPPLSSCRESLIKGLSLGASLNIAQLAQGENVPASLAATSNLRNDLHAFTLKFFEIVLDVAGAQGHNDARCAVAFTEPTYCSYVAVRAALVGLVERDDSLRQAYDQILVQRATVLRRAGFSPNLDVAIPAQRALLRILCMGRATNSKQATLIHKAFSALSPSIRDELVNGLSVDGVDDGTAVIPYYAPSFFALALRATVDKGDEAKIEALSAVLRFLSRIFKGTKPERGKKGRVVECSLNFASKTMSGAEFKGDPSVLDCLEIPDSAYSEEVI